jgi:hypothetical protein
MFFRSPIVKGFLGPVRSGTEDANCWADELWFGLGFRKILGPARRNPVLVMNN